MEDRGTERKEERIFSEELHGRIAEWYIYKNHINLLLVWIDSTHHSH